MNKLTLLTAISALFVGSAVAQAEQGFYFEPGVTYEMGETEGDINSQFLDDSSGTVKGFGVAGKIGMHVNDTFFAGVDIRYSMPNFEDSAVDYDAAAKAYQYGPVVGFQMPNWGARFWGGYVVGGELDPEADGNFDLKFEEASGYTLGGGVYYEAISINLEYQSLSYGDTMVDNPGPNLGTVDSIDYKNDAWIASVSFPIDL